MFSWISMMVLPAFAGDDALVAAVRLPVAAHHLREHGVGDADVKDALKAARDKKLSAGETRVTFEAADAAVDEHGPVDNFGAFVRTQLEEGKRGTDLAAAIKAEHAARGKGKGVGRKVHAGHGDGKPGHGDGKPGYDHDGDHGDRPGEKMKDHKEAHDERGKDHGPSEKKLDDHPKGERAFDHAKDKKDDKDDKKKGKNQ